jgi:hypothetical protein
MAAMIPAALLSVLEHLVEDGTVPDHARDLAHPAIPLMKMAHGYARAVFSLSSPAARAELVPDEPFDLRRWRLRVWNLGTGEDAVTWHVDTAKLMPIRPDGLPGAGTAAAITLDGVSGDITPGTTPWESPAFTLFLSDQASLNATSHTVVVLEGTIGSQHKTPIVYGLPMPNALPLVPWRFPLRRSSRRWPRPSSGTRRRDRARAGLE